MNRNTIYTALFFLVISSLSAFVLIRSNAADDEMIRQELAKPYVSNVVIGRYTVTTLVRDSATFASLNSASDLADILNTEGVQGVSWVERDSGKLFLCEKKNVEDLAFTRTELKQKKN